MLTEFQVGESGIPKGSKEKVIMHFLELAGRHNWVPPRGDETTSARQQEDSNDSHDCNSTDSDDSNSSIQFELERIVSGHARVAQIKASTLSSGLGMTPTIILGSHPLTFHRTI